MYVHVWVSELAASQVFLIKSLFVRIYSMLNPLRHIGYYTYHLTER